MERKRDGQGSERRKYCSIKVRGPSLLSVLSIQFHLIKVKITNNTHQLIQVSQFMTFGSFLPIESTHNETETTYMEMIPHNFHSQPIIQQNKRLVYRVKSQASYQHRNQ